MVMPPPIRPTFDLDVPMTVEETVAALRAAFRAAGEHPFQSTGQHVVVTVPPGVRHFWSPCLTMEAQAVGSGVRLHGRFSPKPAIWTGFMLSYIALTTAGCFGLMFAASQAIIHRSPILAAGLALAFLLAALGMYLSSQFGQRLARGQMDELLTLVRRALALGDAPAAASPANTADRSDNPPNPAPLAGG
jgi:hypothetical protein